MYNLYPNLPPEDQDIRLHIASQILLYDYEDKPHSNNFCGIFCDGRPRPIDSYSDWAAFRSFKDYSEKNYPCLAFVGQTEGFLGGNQDLIDKWRIKVIKIDGIDSHEKYSEFMINQVFFEIPQEFENLLIFAPDAHLIRPGFEKAIKDSNSDWLSAHWLHFGGIEVLDYKNWILPYELTSIGNGALSYRVNSKCRKISKLFSGFVTREKGTTSKVPSEDLFYSFWGFGSGIMRKPSIEACRNFCRDPMDWADYNQRISIGYHHAKAINEWKNRF